MRKMRSIEQAAVIVEIPAEVAREVRVHTLPPRAITCVYRPGSPGTPPIRRAPSSAEANEPGAGEAAQTPPRSQRTRFVVVLHRSAS
jgi:hypothetical protein